MGEILYGFYHNDNIHESAAALMSLHRSKENAEKALVEHKAKEFSEWEEYRKNCLAEDPTWPVGEFGQHQHWDVWEIEVLP